MKILTIPNMLTLFRILCIPVIVICLLIDGHQSRWWALIIYALAGFTDFFDGFLARVLHDTSKLGQFLDPIADKLLVSAVIMVLINNRILDGWHVIPSLVILMREIIISGLREFLAEVRHSMPVTKAAKWKTLSQIFALGFLIVGTSSPHWIPSLLIGKLLFWFAAGLTLVTGYTYLKNAWFFLE